MHQSLNLAAVTCLFVGLSVGQSTVVIPRGWATQPSFYFSQGPWGFPLPVRTQDVYDSTHFTMQGINYPIIIRRLRWRCPPAFGSGAGHYNLATVQMSTCPVDQASLSTVFASNHGLDRTTVYAGPVNVLATAPPPNNWYVDIWLSTPFSYDPSAGDLNIDIMTDATGWIGGAGWGPELAGNSQASSVEAYGSLSPTLGYVYPNLARIVELTYTSTSGLYAYFSAAPTIGTSPHLVQFTDYSFSSDPGGITSWNWDVDGDGVTDYTTPNPVHSYACGTYNVSLTVTDASHPSSTLTRTGLIVVDQMTANFGVSPRVGFAPLQVQFTDTSIGPVTGWSWDLDGDSIPDSTLQHPSFVYTSPGTYTVSLTATNACRTSTRSYVDLITVAPTGVILAPPELLQYQFNDIWGNYVANTASTMAAPPLGAILHTTDWREAPNHPGFAGNQGYGCLKRTTNPGTVHYAPAVNTGWTCSFTGSFSASFWLRKLGSAPSTMTSQGYVCSDGLLKFYVGGAPFNGMVFESPITGAVFSGFSVNGTPGIWQHVALVVDDAAGRVRWYSNGVVDASFGSFPPNTFAYSNNYVMGVGGSGIAGVNPVGLLGYDMDDFRLYSRALSPADVWIIASSKENASAGSSGSSCPGPGGTPVISGNGLPTIGNPAFAINLTNAEDNRLALMVLGLGPLWTTLPTLPPWVTASCPLQTDVVVALLHTTAANGASHPFGIPNNTAFAGLHVYAQWVVLGSQGAVTQLLDINVQ